MINWFRISRPVLWILLYSGRGGCDLILRNLFDVSPPSRCRTQMAANRREFFSKLARRTKWFIVIIIILLFSYFYLNLCEYLREMADLIIEVVELIISGPVYLFFLRYHKFLACIPFIVEDGVLFKTVSDGNLVIFFFWQTNRAFLSLQHASSGTWHYELVTSTPLRLTLKG